jgi:hypothetical protein
MPLVSLDRATIADDLRTYGEDELAERIQAITEGQRIQIGWAAGRHWEGFEGARGMQLRKAVALAAVEVLEGQIRPLARSKARS